MENQGTWIFFKMEVRAFSPSPLNGERVGVRGESGKNRSLRDHVLVLIT
jgi:hypothetical protein